MPQRSKKRRATEWSAARHVRRAAGTGALMTLGTLCLYCSAPQEVGSQRKDISNIDAASAGTNPSVGTFNIHGECTASLICPTMVITARHCLAALANPLPSGPVGGSFTLPDGQSANITGCTSFFDKPNVPPGQEDDPPDMMVCTLSHPLCIKGGYANVTPTPNRPITVCQCGITDGTPYSDDDDEEDASDSGDAAPDGKPVVTPGVDSKSPSVGIKNAAVSLKDAQVDTKDADTKDAQVVDSGYPNFGPGPYCSNPITIYPGACAQFAGVNCRNDTHTYCFNGVCQSYYPEHPPTNHFIGPGNSNGGDSGGPYFECGTNNLVCTHQGKPPGYGFGYDWGPNSWCWPITPGLANMINDLKCKNCDASACGGAGSGGCGTADASADVMVADAVAHATLARQALPASGVFTNGGPVVCGDAAVGIPNDATTDGAACPDAAVTLTKPPPRAEPAGPVLPLATPRQASLVAAPAD